MIDHIMQFCDAMRSRGLIPPAQIVGDGEIHRCDAEGKGGKGDGAYLLHLDDFPAGGLENHRDGLGWETWKAETDRQLSAQEREQQRQHFEAARLQREEEHERRRREARENAKAIWSKATPAPTDHSYLAKKGIQPHGTRVSEGALVVPVAENGKLHSLQFISDHGKKFLPGGRVGGCYFPIGDAGDVICIAEGFATAASIHEATGHCAIVAFNAGGLLAVAERIRAKFPEARIIICADDDYRTEGNPGLAKAHEAARAVQGWLALPDFGQDRPDGATDFNDLAAHRGHDAIRASLQAAKALEGVDVPADRLEALSVGPDTPWPSPESLVAETSTSPYPLKSLPTAIADAVAEVAGFVQAPDSMVASCALSVLSIGGQSQIDVERAPHLKGPVTLWFLTIAESGERKTTTDRLFTDQLRTHEAERAETLGPAYRRQKVALEAWEARRNGLKEAIKNASKGGQASMEEEANLVRLEEDKPTPVRVPRLLYDDVTPEKLAHSLGNEWPSAGILSAEAGAVFGSHAMRSDSAMASLSQFNLFWDGMPLRVDRKQGDSFAVRGSRVTLGLQVQESMLREFFDKQGQIVRGGGFIARFCIAWPQSTQGKRLFKEPPQWSALPAFARRIQELLDMRQPINDQGELIPQTLILSPEARLQWIKFHDDVEREIGMGGGFSDIKDVASKAADNVARLAALFHLYEDREGVAIGPNTVRRAGHVIAWHLEEARKFLGLFSMPAAQSQAIRLSRWIVQYAKTHNVGSIPRRTVQRFTHPSLRDRSVFDPAMQELVSAAHVRLIKDGKKQIIEINPELL